MGMSDTTPAERAFGADMHTARLPRIGEPAIPFRVRTTLGERTLDDYRGRWLLLFSHPSDFTPVCTSEFIALAKAYQQFQDLGCDLLGLSVDSLFAHLAWLRSIRDDFNVEIPFPIAEDLSMAIATAYGMIHPADTDTSTVRATFLIDPAGIVRLLTYYPMATGRSIDELLRALAALQETDASGLSTPAGWQPGDIGVLPPPVTVMEADEREKGGAPAWYYLPRAVRP
jgi:peroxiredoxin 2/4